MAVCPNPSSQTHPRGTLCNLVRRAGLHKPASTLYVRDALHKVQWTLCAHRSPAQGLGIVQKGGDRDVASYI